MYKGGPADALVVASRERRPSVDAAALFAERTMAKLLADAGVRSPSEIDMRWRGDSSVFNVLLAAYDAPANSDFRPYVDQRSQRTRFLTSNFQPLFEASIGPTAMLEVLGASAPRTPGAENALGAALAAGVAVPAGANASLPQAHASYADALRATRELFVSCRPGGPVPVLIEGAVGTAMVINDLPAARAQAVWNGVREGGCYRSLDPAARLWIDLFAAVAARDAAAMSEFGGAALSAAPSDFVRNYALSAAVTGDIALGRPELGAARLDTFAGAQQSTWLTVLREASAGRTIAPANGRDGARQAAVR